MKHPSSVAVVVLLSAISAYGQTAPAASTPVTSPMLQNPDPADWLMWRRTLNSWGYSPLNQITAEILFLLPVGGDSALDAAGQPFWDPEADAALFETLASEFQQTDRRKLVRLPFHINDPNFAQAGVEEFLAIARQ